MLTEHLLVQGHRNIGYISGERGGFNADERFRGFLDAHEKFGVQPNDELLFTPDMIMPSVRIPCVGSWLPISLAPRSSYPC